MDNLDLNALFSSPETIEKVIGIVKGLVGTSIPDASDAEKSAAASAADDIENSQESTTPPLALPALADTGTNNQELLRKAMSIFAEYSRDDDDIRLLRSLRGHIAEPEHVEKAIEVLRLSRSVRQILNMLKGGGAHVLNL